MAYPTSMAVVNLPRYRWAGVTVEVYPSTVRGLTVEIQAATANTTATSMWRSHVIGPSTGGEPMRYTVPVAYSTTPYYFRARHPAGAGYSNGPFTPTISARAKVTPDVVRPFIMQMGYQGNVEAPSGSDVFVSSSKTVKVGTQPTTGSRTKSLRWPADQFLPVSTGQKYNRGVGSLSVGTTGSTNAMQALYVFPKGITLTKYRIRGRRSTAGETLTVTLYRVSTGAVASTVSTIVFGVTGAAQGTVESTVLNETVGDSNYYIAKLSLASKAVATLPFVVYTEFDYTMPNYAAQY